MYGFEPAQSLRFALVGKLNNQNTVFRYQPESQGLGRLEAIHSAAVARFRPILMTSLSTILGAVPIALALGAGSESRVAMGTAIIGGLTFATLLTLFVIPAMYAYISEREKNVSNVGELLDNTENADQTQPI